MSTKCSVAASFVVLMAAVSTACGALQTTSSEQTEQSNGTSSATGAASGATADPPGDNLASAMANFSVRTGLVLAPNAEGQVAVQYVRPESDAARSGIKPGDVLTSVNSTETNTIRALQKYLTGHASQSAFSVGMGRGRQNFTQPLGRQVSLLGMTIFPDAADRPLVYSVQEGSPAGRAGIRPGDLIISVGDRTTDTMTKFMNFSVLFVRAVAQGQDVTFGLARNGSPMAVSIPRPKDSELEPLTPAERRILDRQGGVLSTATQTPLRPMSAAIRPPGDLTSVVAVLYAPAQHSTRPGATRGTVGYVMIQATVPPLPAGATALPETNTSVQPPGSFLPSTVPFLGGTRVGPPLHAHNVTVAVSAQLSGLPEGQYKLAVGQYGDCTDLAAIAAQPVAVSLGTIQVHSDGRGSLQSAPIAYAPRDFLAHVVAVVAPAAPGTGNLAVAQATVTTGNTISTGIWGCGTFHLANPRHPLPGEHPEPPESRPIPSPVNPGPSAPVTPPPRPVPDQP